MVEQWTFNPLVLGSSPRGGTGFELRGRHTKQLRTGRTCVKVRYALSVAVVRRLRARILVAMQRLSRSTRAAGTVACALVLAIVTFVSPAGGHLVAADEPDGATDLSIGSDELTGSASAYRPINPIRVLDTRRDSGIARLWLESSISVDPVTETGVAEAAGVDPSEITAVVVNATVINAGATTELDTGFATVWPTGSKRLATSTNNTEFEGHTIPNLVIAPLGLEHKISLYASIDADVALDVLGVFTASGPTAAGRFESLGPERAFDTRDRSTAEFDRNETRKIDLTSVGVPESATGVVMNVTAIRSKGPGFYRVWSSGDPQPEHSSVNVLDADYQAGNQVISGIDDGKINVFTNVGGGLTIDVTGYFTGEVDDDGEPSGESIEGLYVPFTPGRLLDTRKSSGSTGLTSGKKLNADDAFDLTVARKLDIPADGAKAVALNLTAIRSAQRGFVKAFPGGTSEPETSSLNFTTGGQTVPNHAITSINPESGEITLIASSETHLAIDATGYFLAEGATPPEGGAAVTKVVDPATVVPEPLPDSAPTEGPYDFLFDRQMFFESGSRPNPTVRTAWPVCRPFRYALNVDLAENDDQIQILIDSVEEIERYSGIDFQYAGVTSAGMNLDDPILFPESFRPEAPFKYLPPDPNGADSVSAVIGFSNNDDTFELSMAGVIGVAGSLTGRAGSDGRAQAVRGFAVIDLVELYEDGPSGSRSLANIKATTTHELGHMMGLGHIDTSSPGLAPGFSDEVVRDQLMFPFLNPFAGVDFDLGDQRGLYELYSASYCPPVIDSLGAGADTAPTVDLSGATVVKSVDDYG